MIVKADAVLYETELLPQETESLTLRIARKPEAFCPFPCHPREGGGPGQVTEPLSWIPAFAGMTPQEIGGILSRWHRA
jgi:hypothetical protein